MTTATESSARIGGKLGSERPRISNQAARALGSRAGSNCGSIRDQPYVARTPKVTRGVSAPARRRARPLEGHGGEGAQSPKPVTSRASMPLASQYAA